MRWAVLVLGMVTMANFSPEQLVRALMMQQASAQESRLSFAQRREMLARRLHAGEITIDEYSAMSKRLAQDYYSQERSPELAAAGRRQGSRPQTIFHWPAMPARPCGGALRLISDLRHVLGRNCQARSTETLS
jgi:hypothetical protein